MTQLTVTRTPSTIANEIYSIKGQARQVILYSSVEIGRRLIEAKEMLAHGEWGTWLENSVEYSQSTANNLMQIYREYGDDMSKFPTLANLSYTKALALIGVPADEREQFAQDHDVEAASARELQQAIKEKQKLEKELKAAEKRADEERLNTQKLAQDITRLNVQIADAKIAGNEESAKHLQEELRASQRRVKNLETELANKPVDVPAVVEKIPEAVEAELAELRKLAGQPRHEEAVKFKLCFEALARGFQDLLGALAAVENVDPQAHEKYKTAVSGLLGKMSERL